MNAIDDRYKRALIDEHEAYVRVGRTADAAQVAKVLRDQYGHDVNEKAESEATVTESVTRTAAEPRLPEAAVEPKPEPAGAEVKPAAKKATAKRAAAKPTEGK